MTVSSTNNQNRYEGNGTTDTFSFEGRVFSTSDLVVQILTRATDAVVETLTITTDYSVTVDTDNEGASIVVEAGKIPSALQDILIYRDLTQTQTVDLPTGTRFPAVNVENALDKLTALVQDVSEKFDRTLILPITSSATIPGIGSLTADEVVVYDGTDFITTGLSTDDISDIATDVASASNSASAASASASAASASADAAAASAAAAEAVIGFDGNADTINYDNTTSGLTAEDVQAAIDEVEGLVDTVEAAIDPTVNAIGSIGGGTQDIDLDDGRTITATVDTSETTFTFSNPTATGNADAFDLYLTNGGSQTINWPASVDWELATAPTLTSSGLDHLVFTTVDGGTTWYGYVAGLDMG